MKKQLLTIAMSLALPLASFAGATDVTLTTATTLTVGSYSLTVSGTSAVVQSVTVGASSFSVVLLPGSVIAVSSATGQVLSNDASASNITGNQCSGGVSTLTLSSASGSAVTVTVTPSSSTCTGTATNSASAAAGNGAPGGGGGGGGGGYNFITPPNTVQPVPTVQTTIVIAPAVTAVPAVQATVASVTFPSYSFKKPLSTGVTSTDVKKLQEMLNADPETKVSSSGAGSPGKESSYFGSATKKAVQKFQVKHKIAKPGDAGYGSVGPATRAKLTELGSGIVSVSSTTTSTSVQTSSTSATDDIAKQLNDSLKLLQQLQEKLKTATN